MTDLVRREDVGSSGKGNVEPEEGVQGGDHDAVGVDVDNSLELGESPEVEFGQLSRGVGGVPRRQVMWGERQQRDFPHNGEPLKVQTSEPGNFWRDHHDERIESVCVRERSMETLNSWEEGVVSEHRHKSVLEICRLRLHS